MLNTYIYFLKGNTAQRRKILEIISEEITYKNKKFDIKLRPTFQTIAENQYNLTCGSGSVDEIISSFPQEGANIRTLEMSINKGLEPNSNPKLIKNSPQCTSLELFVEKLYANIRDVHNAKIINLIEHYKNIA